MLDYKKLLQINEKLQNIILCFWGVNKPHKKTVTIEQLGKVAKIQSFH